MFEIFEDKLFLKDTMKKVTWFFPLQPVTFYGQNFEKQKFLGLVTSLFELQDMLTKNLFFGLTLWIWKLWKEKGKNDKRLNK